MLFKGSYFEEQEVYFPLKKNLKTLIGKMSMSEQWMEGYQS